MQGRGRHVESAHSYAAIGPLYRVKTPILRHFFLHNPSPAFFHDFCIFLHRWWKKEKFPPGCVGFFPGSHLPIASRPHVFYSRQVNRPGFSFLICPDSELIRDHIERLLSATPHSWRREVFWGDEEITDSFWSALTVNGLFAEHKAVVVRRAEALPADFWPKLDPALRGFNDLVWPFFCMEKPVDKRAGPKLLKAVTSRPFYKVAEKRKWIWTSPGLTREGMAPMLRDWAAGRGLTFAQGAREAWAAALPLDQAHADRELAKLELSLDGRTEIRRQDLELLSHHDGMDMFTFLRAFSERGSAVEVWRRIFDQQLAGDDMIFAFLGLLISDARQMWQLAYGDPGAVRLPPFVRTKKEALARKLGPAGLSRIWDLAMDAEMGIKTGAKKSDQAMEFLAAELFTLFMR